MTDGKESWHLDKRLPIAIIAALVVQTATLLYTDATWRAQTVSRLEALENAVADNVSIRRKQWDRLDLIEAQQTKLDAKLSGLDERTRSINRQTDQILGLLLRESRPTAERRAP